MSNTQISQENTNNRVNINIIDTVYPCQYSPLTLNNIKQTEYLPAVNEEQNDDSIDAVYPCQYSPLTLNNIKQTEYLPVVNEEQNDDSIDAVYPCQYSPLTLNNIKQTEYLPVVNEEQNDDSIDAVSIASTGPADISPVSSDVLKGWFNEKLLLQETTNRSSIVNTASLPVSHSYVNRIKQMRNVHEEALEIFARKNADYGDSFAEHGPIGVIIRMKDKISRLTKLTDGGGIRLVQDESVRDTLLDLHNYSAMALMLIDENE